MKLKNTITTTLAVLTATAILLLLVRTKSSVSRVNPSITDAPVNRTNLSLVGGHLCRSGQTNAFTGIMIENASDGSLRSRSMISNGWLHGLSEGWHTNGQLQVTEHFKESVSHGIRTKWYPNGTKLSEGMIVDGMFHGTFRRWSDSGALAEQIEFVSGQPDGMAVAYFESGFLKTRAIMLAGKVIEQASWKDGENKETVAERSVKTSPAKAF